MNEEQDDIVARARLLLGDDSYNPSRLFEGALHDIKNKAKERRKKRLATVNTPNAGPPLSFPITSSIYKQDGDQQLGDTTTAAPLPFPQVEMGTEAGKFEDKTLHEGETGAQPNENISLEQVPGTSRMSLSMLRRMSVKQARLSRAVPTVDTPTGLSATMMALIQGRDPASLVQSVPTPRSVISGPVLSIADVIAPEGSRSNRLSILPTNSDGEPLLPSETSTEGGERTQSHPISATPGEEKIAHSYATTPIDLSPRRRAFRASLVIDKRNAIELAALAQQQQEELESERQTSIRSPTKESSSHSRQSSSTKLQHREINPNLNSPNSPSLNRGNLRALSSLRQSTTTARTPLVSDLANSQNIDGNALASESPNPNFISHDDSSHPPTTTGAPTGSKNVVPGRVRVGGVGADDDPDDGIQEEYDPEQVMGAFNEAFKSAHMSPVTASELGGGPSIASSFSLSQYSHDSEMGNDRSSPTRSLIRGSVRASLNADTLATAAMDRPESAIITRLARPSISDEGRVLRSAAGLKIASAFRTDQSTSLNDASNFRRDGMAPSIAELEDDSPGASNPSIDVLPTSIHKSPTSVLLSTSDEIEQNTPMMNALSQPLTTSSEVMNLSASSDFHQPRRSGQSGDENKIKLVSVSDSSSTNEEYKKMSMNNSENINTTSYIEDKRLPQAITSICYHHPHQVPDPLPFKPLPPHSSVDFISHQLSGSYALAAESIVDQVAMTVLLVKWLWAPVNLLCKTTADQKRKELSRQVDRLADLLTRHHQPPPSSNSTTSYLSSFTTATSTPSVNNVVSPFSYVPALAISATNEKLASLASKGPLPNSTSRYLTPQHNAEKFAEVRSDQNVLQPNQSHPTQLEKEHNDRMQLRSLLLTHETIRIESALQTALKALKAATSGLPLPPLPIEQPFRLGFIGCGRIGNIIVKSLIERGIIAGSHLIVATRRPERLQHLSSMNIHLTRDPKVVLERCPLIIIAVAPHQLASVAQTLYSDMSSLNKGLTSLLPLFIEKEDDTTEHESKKPNVPTPAEYEQTNSTKPIETTIFDSDSTTSPKIIPGSISSSLTPANISLNDTILSNKPPATKPPATKPESQRPMGNSCITSSSLSSSSNQSLMESTGPHNRSKLPARANLRTLPPVASLSPYLTSSEPTPIFLSLCAGVSIQKLEACLHTPLVTRTRVPIAHAHIGAHHLYESSVTAMNSLLDEVFPLVRRMFIIEIHRYLDRIVVPSAHPSVVAEVAAHPDPTFGAISKLDQLLLQAAEHVNTELIPSSLKILQAMLDDSSTAPVPFPFDANPPSFRGCGVVPDSFGTHGPKLN